MLYVQVESYLLSYGYTSVSDIQHWTGTTCKDESRPPYLYQLEDVNDEATPVALLPIPQHSPWILYKKQRSTLPQYFRQPEGRLYLCDTHDSFNKLLI